MAKEEQATGNPFFQIGLYKPTQGRIARQLTAVALGLVFIVAAWRMKEFFEGPNVSVIWTYVLPGLLLFLGLWFSYRMVNVRKFADFLIAVEAEMSKVSWPTRTELIRSSVVVIVVMIVLAVVLFGFDIVWRWIFERLGVIYR